MIVSRRSFGFGFVLVFVCFWSRQVQGEQACRVVQQQEHIELQSPFFRLRLDTAVGLRAKSWENRLTGWSLPLGDGPEMEFDIGLPDGRLQSPPFEVTDVEVKAQGETAELVVHLRAGEPGATAELAYRWNAKQPVLRKFVTIRNVGGRPWDRLLNVRLGHYDTAGASVIDKPSGGTYSVPAPRVFPSTSSTHVERGFPVYAAHEYFFTLAHPAGVAEGAGGKLSLRQYPGARVAPGETFTCMEVVYGVAQAGEVRQAFVDHVRSRMRRVVRGHDRPYAIFEPFGARPNGDFNETEEFVLDSIAKVAQGQREAGCHFDLYSVDFWVDYQGTLKECDPQRFPRGLQPIRRELDKLGTALGLWIDGSWEGWSIGGNPSPDVQACLNYDLQKPETLNQVQLGRKAFCRAAEPIRSMYAEAFRYHIREHGVRLLKFDNTSCICANPYHGHLTGLYSTEAIENALIEFFQKLDAECPDVFLMLYWGYKSPWWLMHADTLFDSGIDIEAASPNDQPTPCVRDSITQTLDQAQWMANQNLPPLGKDSLGVWLSDWSWNSQVGKERWESGFVMDLCRGSMLAQPWSDTPWLSPPERRQMAEFIALLKAQPGCFGNSRFVLGDPHKQEPYGYCCTDGKRAFLALYNCCWSDRVLRLELNSAWGLPDGQPWDLYRWYPDPTRLTHPQGLFGDTASIALRPFEIVLLEVVPHGQTPTLDRQFETRPIPNAFAEPSRLLDLEIVELDEDEKDDAEEIWTVLDPARFESAGGATLHKLADKSILADGQNPSPETYTIVVPTELSAITGFRLEVLPDPSLPCDGPGRAINGNFALDEFSVTASPRNGSGEAVCVKLRHPTASFSQHTYGGWPITAALDGDPKTGWSIDPLEGERHVAVFEAQQPVGFSGGTTLQFVLRQGVPADHNLGRLRLAATTAKPPLPSPPPSGLRSLVVRGQIPASDSGGLLVISIEMTRDSQPMHVRGPGKYFTVDGKLAGRTVAWKSVVGTDTYPCCWQAWRLPVAASTQAQPFELTIKADFAPDVGLCPKGHFVPGTDTAVSEPTILR
jgi:hypothetical protein